MDNTRDEEDEDVHFSERNHRHYDEFMEGEPVGAKYPARYQGVPSARRRKHSQLCASRYAPIEPIGDTREPHYQQRLLLGLAWFSPAPPQLVEEDGKPAVLWTMKASLPASLASYKLPDITLQLSSSRTSLLDSFEDRCTHYENLFKSSDLNLICPCCEGQIKDGPCSACQYAVGFHVCPNPHNTITGHRWRPGTLIAGPPWNAA